MTRKRAKKYGLSDFQLIAVITGTIIGAGITILPRTVAENAGRDGWLSIGIAGVLVWVAAGLVYLLCRRFPSKTLPEFSVLILGKPLGILASSAYAIFVLVIGGTALRIFAELVKTWVFIWQPIWLFPLLILIPVVYITRLGPVSLGRLMELVFYLTIVAFLLFSLSLREFNILNLRPLGAEGLAAILSGVPEASFAFLGFDVLLVFFPLVVNRQRIFRIYMLALTLITFVYILNTVFIYGVMGVESALLQDWPLIHYLRIGTTPILERVDKLFLYIWTAQVTVVVGVRYYVGTFIFSTLAGKTHHDLWALLLWPALYAVAMLPQSQLDIFNVSGLVGLWGFVLVITLVLLLLIVAVIRGLDESGEVFKK